MSEIATSREAAARLDADDPLAAKAREFDLASGVIYLNGNSLGPAPKAALARLRRAAEQEWAEDLIQSWNKAGWIDLPKTCGAKIARLIGVGDDEVLACDSVSVNIFKLASALIARNPGRALACPASEFPTDGYILEGLARQTGAALLRLPEGAPPEVLNEKVGVLIKSAVDYKTATVADIAAWEKIAADRHVSIVWDLSHAAGVCDLQLKRDGARFAVGCGYKYLNGGPGAPAFIYVAEEETERLRQPLSGWMGHAAPFDFSQEYTPAPGVARFAAGTPNILSLSALDAALDLFDGVDMGEVEKKARLLGDLFLELTKGLGLQSISPPVGEPRGGHISLRGAHSYEIVQALIARGVICDFRAPDIMRFGFSPLFLSYRNIRDAAEILRDILETEEWRDPRYAVRRKVT